MTSASLCAAITSTTVGVEAQPAVAATLRRPDEHRQRKRIAGVRPGDQPERPPHRGPKPGHGAQEYERVPAAPLDIHGNLPAPEAMIADAGTSAQAAASSAGASDGRRLEHARRGHPLPGAGRRARRDRLGGDPGPASGRGVLLLRERRHGGHCSATRPSAGRPTRASGSRSSIPRTATASTRRSWPAWSERRGADFEYRARAADGRLVWLRNIVQYDDSRAEPQTHRRADRHHRAQGRPRRA